MNQEIKQVSIKAVETQRKGLWKRYAEACNRWVGIFKNPWHDSVGCNLGPWAILERSYRILKHPWHVCRQDPLKS